MKEAGGAPLVFGAGRAYGLFGRLKNCLVISEEEIWQSVADCFVPVPSSIYYLSSLELVELEKFASKSMRYEAVVGLGGGRAADIAKFISWKNSIPLYQVPTIMSVDAFFTHEIAVRENGVVRYIGDAVAEEVVVDSDIIARAPKLLNRSGLGDILSCHTGLFDWHMADRAGHLPAWNDELASNARDILYQVLEHTGDIRAVSPKGMEVTMNALSWIGEQCYVQGHPRFEEGSEHHFVYNLEYLTGKPYVHGQAVCLGCVIMSLFQENEPEKVQRAVRDASIDIRPEALGIESDAVVEALRTLNEFVHRENLPYTILHEKKVEEDFITTVMNLIYQES